MHPPFHTAGCLGNRRGKRAGSPEPIPGSARSSAANNLAALPAESDAELAAAMPTIDELRHRRGSLLDGTLLENAPAEPALADTSYLDLLRREARRLDHLAADFEDQSRFDEADERRYEANQLRRQARKIHDDQRGSFNSRYSR
jgi:hypothetical protein